MAQSVEFPTILEALLDEGKPFPARFLHRFSDIPLADLQALLKVWPQLSARRKQVFLEDLEDLAESDTLLSFEDVARELLEDPEPAVRTQAIRLLSESRDEKLAGKYIGLLETDGSEEVRVAAAEALGQFVYLGELEEIPAALHHHVEDVLLAAARSASSPAFRRRALESLGYSGREEVPVLIEAAYHDGSPDWQASALFAMGRSCDPRWERLVLSKLHAPNEDVRSEAVQAAGELGLGAARSGLLDLLEDEEEPEQRHEVIWALSKIGGEGVRSRLEELLDAESDDEESEFLEGALENLSFTEDLSHFDMFSFDPGDEQKD
jgi:HEAT repeat protein